MNRSYSGNLLQTKKYGLLHIMRFSSVFTKMYQVT